MPVPQRYVPDAGAYTHTVITPPRAKNRAPVGGTTPAPFIQLWVNVPPTVSVPRPSLITVNKAPVVYALAISNESVWPPAPVYRYNPARTVSDAVVFAVKSVRANCRYPTSVPAYWRVPFGKLTEVIEVPERVTEKNELKPFLASLEAYQSNVVAAVRIAHVLLFAAAPVFVIQKSAELLEISKALLEVNKPLAAVQVSTSVPDTENRKSPDALRYNPEFVSEANVRAGAPTMPLVNWRGADMPPCPERLNESVRAVAMSENVLLAHVLEIVVPVTTGLPGVYSEYVPEELRDIVPLLPELA